MQYTNHQEIRHMAMNAERLAVASLRQTSDPSPTISLKRLVDIGSRYQPQNLNSTQFATLQAITTVLSYPGSRHAASRLDASLVASASLTEPHFPALPIASDYKLALDEVENISHTRTGYSFTELPLELQCVILNLVASRDLASGKLDLARWLEDLRTHIQALAA